MLAGGYIALRMMRLNHTMVVSCYVNITLMVVSVICVTFVKGNGFGFIFHLSGWSWLLFVLIAFVAMGDQITKFMALKYCEASKL